MPKRVGDPKAPMKARDEKRAVLSLIQNRTLIELFKDVDKKYVKKMRAADNVADRERSWAILRALDALYLEMKSRIDRGTAQEKIDQALRQRREGAETP
jgi:hypothetical protein